MFEFHIIVRCPYCDEDQHVQACFNDCMDPVKTTENCHACDKEFSIQPMEPEIDAWVDKIKKPMVKKNG